MCRSQHVTALLSSTSSSTSLASWMVGGLRRWSIYSWALNIICTHDFDQLGASILTITHCWKNFFNQNWEQPKSMVVNKHLTNNNSRFLPRTCDLLVVKFWSGLQYHTYNLSCGANPISIQKGDGYPNSYHPTIERMRISFYWGHSSRVWDTAWDKIIDDFLT